MPDQRRLSPTALPLLTALVALACREGDGVEPTPSNRVAGAASVPATSELTETFEALPAGPTADYAFIDPDVARYHTGTGALSVSDETASEGTRSLKLAVGTDVPNQYDRAAAQFCVPVAITRRFTARFDIRFENFANWAAITVGPGTGFPEMSGGPLFWWTRANGTLFWRDTIFTWDPRRWYQVEVVMDLARDQASIAIDGVVRQTLPVTSLLPSVMGPPRCLLIATAWNQGPQTIFVDNVRLSATNACHEQPGSPACVDPAAHLHPFANCIVDRGEGKFSAVFGFHNAGTTNANIGVPGTTVPNRVSPGGPDRGQPRWFPRGAHRYQFVVDSDGPDVAWTLGARTAVASSSTVRCSQPFLGEANGRLLVDPARALASSVVATTPAGGVAPGKLAGALDVSSTGAAVYSLPIRVPAGRLGMQPALSLTYNSASKTNGHLGVGWSLSGLSQIQRCTKTQYQDGAAGPIRMQPTDAFCLDGERLVTVSNPGAPPVYATERHDYSRISAFGSTSSGPQYFEVRARDGRILIYGYPGGAPANDPGDKPARYASFEPPDLDVPSYTGGTNPDHSVILDWPLTQVRDRFGNSVTFTYAADSGSDADGHAYERWPVAIHYTGHPQFPARRSVRFRWAASSSPEMRGRDIDRVSFQYVGGVKVKTSRLLEAIEIWAPNPAAPQKIRSYELAYERSPSTDRARLRTVRECDAAGACIGPSTFSYTDAAEGFDEQPTSIRAVDLAGGGLRERYQFDPSAGIQTADINGDGLDDVLYRFFDGTTMDWGPPRYHLSNGRDFGPQKAVAPGSGNAPESPLASLSPLLLADLNGDGAADFGAVKVVQGSASINFCRLDDPEAGGACSPLGSGTVVDLASVEASKLGALLVDLDGDGLPEVARTNRDLFLDIRPNVEGELRPYRGFVPLNLTETFAPGTDILDAVSLSTADVNGDGRTELLMLPSDRPGDRLRGWSLGAQGAAERFDTNLPAKVPWLVDVTGDGLPDAIERRPRPGPSPAVFDLMVRVNTGNGFLPPARVASSGGDAPFPGGGALLDRDDGVRFMDYDQDGSTDMILVDDGQASGSATRTDVALLRFRKGEPGLRDPATATGIPVGAAANGPAGVHYLTNCQTISRESSSSAMFAVV